MDIKINKWIVFIEYKPYVIDFTNENINDKEIAMCIEEQVFKK